MESGLVLRNALPCINAEHGSTKVIRNLRCANLLQSANQRRYTILAELSLPTCLYYVNSVLILALYFEATGGKMSDLPTAGTTGMHEAMTNERRYAG